MRHAIVESCCCYRRTSPDREPTELLHVFCYMAAVCRLGIHTFVETVVTFPHWGTSISTNNYSFARGEGGSRLNNRTIRTKMYGFMTNTIWHGVSVGSWNIIIDVAQGPGSLISTCFSNVIQLKIHTWENLVFHCLPKSYQVFCCLNLTEQQHKMKKKNFEKNNNNITGEQYYHVFQTGSKP